MKLPKAILLVPVLLVFFTGTALAKQAPKRAGLDRSFGRHGKVVLSVQTSGPSGSELLANGSDGLDHQLGLATKILPFGRGRLLIASGTRLFSFEADGKLNPQFGDGGVLEMPVPPGRLLVPRAVALDPQGRILVAGEAEDVGAYPEPLPTPPPFPGLHGPQRVRAAVMRLLPDGELDPSFGSGGVVESTFGVPAPTAGTGGAYATPVAQATAITADSEGHPIVTGDFVTKSLDCYPFIYSTFETRGFAARLGVDGTVESVSTDPTVASSQLAVSLSPSRTDQFLFLGWQGGHCLRVPDGEPQASAATLLDAAGGSVAGTYTASVVTLGPAAAAVDSKGRPLLSSLWIKEAFEGPQLSQVIRLRPKGTLDTGFGSHGSRFLPAAFQSEFPSEAAAVSVDSSNRPVLLDSFGGYQETDGFRLARLTARGAIDQRFGRNGVVTIPFPRAARTKSAAVMVDGAGRIVLAGRVEVEGTQGEQGQIEIARFIPGS